MFTVDMPSNVLEIVIWQQPVANFAALKTTYPNPTDGWTVTTLDSNYTYKYSTASSSWILTSTNSVGVVPSSITTAGIVKLVDSVTSTSVNDAATPNSVKQAYDLASSKLAANAPANGLQGAYVDWNAVSGGASIKNKPSIPAAYSDKQAQQAVAGMLALGTQTGITFRYDDVHGKLNATVTAGGGSGGGSSITRYEAGAGTGCYVLATGPGVVINKTNNIAYINAPPGVEVISASIHILASEMDSSTFCVIDFGSSQGCGDNSDYTKVFMPQFQVWADVDGNRSFKTGAAGTFNDNSHTIHITGLTSSQAIWVNMSF